MNRRKVALALALLAGSLLAVSLAVTTRYNVQVDCPDDGPCIVVRYDRWDGSVETWLRDLDAPPGERF